MARKKKHPEHVNHERWLVSYADFITLLFAFFVVMFAVSQVDAKKLGRFTESFSKAMGIDMFKDSGVGLLPGTDAPSPTPAVGTTRPLPAELERLRIQIEELEKQQKLPSGMNVIVRRNELVVRLSEDLLFDVGDDTLRDAAKRSLAPLAAELANRDVSVRVEGHTDDRPIRTSRFRSNWDLSTARATAVVTVLVADGVPPARLSASGYGEFHPVASNATDEGRKKNRRVDLVVGVTQREEAQ
jgi:chemotaxis protein MotB